MLHFNEFKHVERDAMDLFGCQGGFQKKWRRQTAQHIYFVIEALTVRGSPKIQA